MKKFTTLLMVMLLIVSMCTLTACGEKKCVEVADDAVIITVSKDIMDLTSDTTLSDYMAVLQEKGQFTYKAADGMVSTINDITPSFADNEFWGLYTSDADNSDDAWGTASYNGKEYGSATVGADDLIVKEGCIYIWNISKF